MKAVFLSYNQALTDRVHAILDEQGIREVRLFKFEETNLRKKARVGKLEPDEEAAVAKYQLLAKVIADGYQS